MVLLYSIDDFLARLAPLHARQDMNLIDADELTRGGNHDHETKENA